MKIYTVQGMDKSDYDFSVELYKLGAFYDKEDAIEVAKEEFKKLKLEYAQEIVTYSDTDEYPDEESGGLYMVTDNEFGYYSFEFGYEQKHESHSIAVDEWELKE